ncbi:Ribosomal protein S6 kinase alpha-2, partial [Taenia solium]|eukprot:TsM_001241300 transcript=TsM_001241300 gene=TsM_001241300
MDLKPDNVLLSYSGHVLITDFDRTYDISEGRRPAEAHDLRTTLQYMAPEIANRVEITSKTD